MNHLTLDQLAEQSPVATRELVLLRAELAEANAQLKAAKEQEPDCWRVTLPDYIRPIITIKEIAEDPFYAGSIYPLYTAPIPADHPAVSVPEKKHLPDLMMASYHEAKGWNDCIDAMLSASPAPQGG